MELNLTFKNDNIEIDTKADWNAIIEDKKHSKSIKKSDSVSVLGANGKIDTSTYLTGGIPTFENRTFTYQVYAPVSIDDMAEFESDVRSKMDGRTFQITESDDTEYYWNGEISIGEMTVKGEGIRFVITADVYPLKLAKNPEAIRKNNIPPNSQTSVSIPKSGINSDVLEMTFKQSGTELLIIEIEYNGVIYRIGGQTSILIKQSPFIFICDGSGINEEIKIKPNQFLNYAEFKLRRGYL